MAQLNYQALQTVRPKYNGFATIVLVATILLAITGFLFSSDFGVIIGTLVIGLLLFATLIVINQLASEHNNVQLTQFAVDNKFGYVGSQKPNAESSTLYGIGHSRIENRIYSGTMHDTAFKLCDYYYTVGSGKNQQTFATRVLKFNLPKRYPHMVIDCIIEGGSGRSSLPISFDSSQKIDLEGDFYKYFALYAPDKFAVNALTVIAPDAMDTLMRMEALCDIEIIDNAIYFYWNDFSVSSQSYQSTIESASSVLDKILPVLQRSDLTRPSNVTLNTAADPTAGVRLKKTPFAKTAIIGVAVVLAYFVGPDILQSIFGSDISGGLINFVIVIALFAIIIGNNQRKKRLRANLRRRYHNN